MNSKPDTQTCSLQTTKKFDKQFEKLPRPVKPLVSKKLLDLSSVNPSLKPKALVGNFKGLHSLRVADYRILIEIDELRKVIVLVAVGHRRKIYD